MLKVHTTDGLTARIDLENPEQAEQWLEQIKDPRFQASITGLTIALKGVQYSLIKPKGFSQVFFLAELVPVDEEHKVKGGEKMTAFLDDVCINVMVHSAQRAVRVSVSKTGKQRFNPFTR